jgi:hypothetical protein
VQSQRAGNTFTAPDEVFTKVPATELLITLSDAKNMVVSRNAFDDAYLLSLIKGLTVLIENRVNLSLTGKTLEAIYRNVAFGVELQFCPLREIVSVTVDGEVVTPDKYEIKGLLRKYLFFKQVINEQFSYLREPILYNEVIVEYEAGYEDCPEEYLVALRQELTFQFQNRGQDQKNELTYPFIERLHKYEMQYPNSNFALYSI